jgi:hypothetical protein
MKREETFEAKMKRFSFDPSRDKISSKITDHSNDPFIVKKNAAARKTIEKYGLPPQLLKIQAERSKK